MLGPRFIIISVIISFLNTISARSGADLLPGRDICGKQKQDRIYGGEEADIGEFPWLALLGYLDDEDNSTDYRCGGSLINSRYVLTAAHCIVEGLYTIRLGEHNLETQEDCDNGAPGLEYCSDPPVEVGIEKIIKHENYNETTIVNDIALIRLKKEVKFTDFVKPICLPLSRELKENDFENVTAMVAGWGKTETKYASEVKLKIEVPVVSNKACSLKYIRYSVFIKESMICAGGVPGKKFCDGDSGGPLMYRHRTKTEENWIEIGVVSFGLTDCIGRTTPGAYTRVTMFMSWILKHLVP